GAGGAGGFGGAGNTDYGSVRVTNDTLSNQYTIDADFERAGNEPLTCRGTRMVGPCKVETCAMNNPPLHNFHAGNLVVSGGAEQVTLPPFMLSGGAVYRQAIGTRMALWAGGETITIRASGDPSGVPAFSGSLAAPRSVTITRLDGQPYDPYARPVIAKNMA